MSIRMVKSGAIDKLAVSTAIMVYEDAITRKAALEFRDDFLKRFCRNEPLNITWSSFAMLEDAAMAEEAAEKAASSDMVVMALRPHTPLPDFIMRWVESWVPRRSEHEGVLVGLMDPSGTGSAPEEKYACLRDAAHRCGMDYWTQLPQHPAYSVPDSLECYSERADCITSVLDEILHHHPARQDLSA